MDKIYGGLDKRRIAPLFIAHHSIMHYCPTCLSARLLACQSASMKFNMLASLLLIT